MDLTISIIAYNNPIETIGSAISSVLGSNLDLRLYLIDHSPAADLNALLPRDPRLEYLHCPENPGFGAGHNRVLREVIGKSRYHLILNPDVQFDSAILREMVEYMDTDPSIGLLSPKIVYPDGTTQYLCKMLPTPADMILRWLFHGSKWVTRRNFRYEMRYTGYNSIMDVPVLSGCFMLARTCVLAEEGGFDDRFFMYFEDFDLSRRIHQRNRTVFYPNACTTHEYQKGAYKNVRLLFILIQSAVRYFNKWGWFMDSERRTINSEVLSRYGNPT